MTYEQVKSLKPEDFKRLCSVRPETFNQMLEVVRSLRQGKQKTGRPSKLSLEDQLLMTLEYWREYRTYKERQRAEGRRHKERSINKN
ncbi:IS5 family transposase [Nostoc calcicola FACHB-389]|nr:transposase family protein [Nostoc calcicola FACHB-3891]MDZ8057191.1 transposase family protein [Nostoc sp. EkiNYC01]OKH33993.1 IS5 family transposase [Nostoc calcicola FACHB-389]